MRDGVNHIGAVLFLLLLVLLLHRAILFHFLALLIAKRLSDYFLRLVLAKHIFSFLFSIERSNVILRDDRIS